LELVVLGLVVRRLPFVEAHCAVRLLCKVPPNCPKRDPHA
jgi:hypothetical protein